MLPRVWTGGSGGGSHPASAALCPGGLLAGRFRVEPGVRSLCVTETAYRPHFLVLFVSVFVQLLRFWEAIRTFFFLSF